MRLYVLARNYQQFKAWCWNKGIPEMHACYVSRAERFRGTTALTDNQIIKLPGFEEHPEYAAIMEQIEARMVTP